MRSDRFSTGMDKAASVARGSPPSSSKGGDTSDTRSTGIPDSVTQPLIFKTFSVYKVWVIFVAIMYPSTISANGKFSVQSSFYSYNCSSNMICLGQAQETTKNLSGVDVGSLSVLSRSTGTGIAYYKDPVMLVDIASGQSASFNSSFAINLDLNSVNFLDDGMAFVISADNHTLGSPNSLGILSADLNTTFKSIVVELYSGSEMDTDYDAIYLETGNTSVQTGSMVIYPTWTETIYAWVEYSNETSQIEVRLSNNNSRPMNTSIIIKVNLLDYVEEYMWVGFSAGSIDPGTYFYIGNWTFESNGVRASNWTFQPNGGPTSDSLSLSPTPAPTGGNSPTPSAIGNSPTRSAIGNSSGKSASQKIGLTVGLSVGSALLVCVIIIVVVDRRFRRPSRYLKWQNLFGKEDPMKKLEGTREDPEIQIEGMMERFNYDQLSVATGGFTEKLGEGGFGSVYRGKFPSSGIEVAVKKINSNSAQGEKEFMAEVSIINQSRHRNLIELRGWCKDASSRQYLLVYELMRNGSVDKWLFKAAEKELPWALRLNIVQGTAAALEYLHHSCTRQVIHRDIKCSNIMLDQDFNAKLGDFGLSRLVDHQGSAPTTWVLDGTHGSIAPLASNYTEKSTLLAGTPGYIAPEALVSPRYTDKTDVYAFGVVVLEVACGRRAYGRHLPREEMILVDWVWERMSQDALLIVLDRRLDDYDPLWMEVMLKVGLLCTHDEPEFRPSMKLVVKMLAGDASVPPIPPRSSNRQRVSISNFLDPKDWDSSNKS